MAAITYNPALELGAPAYTGVLAGRYVRGADYAVHRSKGTSDWLLTMTISGEGAFDVQGTTVTCQTGDVTMLAPGTPHHYGAVSETWAFFWAHFESREEWLPWLQPLKGITGCLHLHMDPEDCRPIAVGFDRLLQHSSALNAYERALAQNAVEELVIRLARHQARSELKFDLRIEQVLTFMQEHLAADISLQALCALAHLSPSRLAHLFKQQTGDSILQVLLRMRLQRAARLLERTGDAVGQIAREVGFASPYYFSRQFKRQFGKSPVAYRRGLDSPSLKDIATLKDRSRS